MATDSVLIKRSAANELEDLAVADRRRIVERIEALAVAPRPSGCQKLSSEEKYRVRQGDLRIVYEVDARSRTVTVVRIGHRREVYP